MGGDESGSPSPLVRAARRARFRAVKSALVIVFTLMFLAGAAGFARGMWERVSAEPQKYAKLKARDGAPWHVRWAADTAAWLAEIKLKPAERPRPDGISRNTEPEHPPPARTGNPNHTASHDPSRPDSRLPEPPDTEPQPKDPTVKVPTPPDTTGQPILPKDPPRPLPTSSGLDRDTADLLEKAHKAFDTAWACHLKSRPDAPESGRDAATKSAIKYLKESKDLYERVLARKIPRDVRTRIEDRLVNLNALLYWSYKHSRVR